MIKQSESYPNCTLIKFAGLNMTENDKPACKPKNLMIKSKREEWKNDGIYGNNIDYIHLAMNCKRECIQVVESQVQLKLELHF